MYTGRTVTAAELRNLPAQPWLDVVASFEAGVVDDADPGSLVERDLRALAEWRSSGRSVVDHPLASGGLGRGYLLAGGRASEAFTVYDGRCQPSPASGPERPAIAATALQDWATCPFRYLLGRVLRVRDVPRPEATESIHPLDEGLLVHASSRSSSASAPQPRRATRGRRPTGTACSTLSTSTAATRRRAASRDGRSCGASLGDGSSGSTLRFLEIDTEMRRAHGAAPRADDLEVGFGVAGQPGVVVPCTVAAR